MHNPRDRVILRTGWLWKKKGAKTLVGREETEIGHGFRAFFFITCPTMGEEIEEEKGLPPSLTPFWSATRFLRRAQLYGSILSLVCPPCWLSGPWASFSVKPSCTWASRT